MSAIEIYGVAKDGDVIWFDEVRNATACALHIWDELGKKYVRPDYMALTHTEVWKLFGEPSRPRWLRLVLGFTFDRVWVKRENIVPLVEALRQFWQEHSKMHNWRGELVDVHPTIPGVIEVLERASKDEDLIGVCFNHTSVNSNPWLVRVYPDGESDEPSDRPHNMLTDKYAPNGQPFWELFEHTAEIEKTEPVK
jgi:hypothetical protein